MSAVNGPSIVNNGIVLQLDAANIKSYPGTGTVWTDLSDQANHGSIQSGVTYNSQGWFDFDGTTGYVSLSTTNGFSYGTDPSTICGWALSTSVSSYRWIFSYGQGVNTRARFIGTFNQLYVFGAYRLDISSGGVPLNTWYHMTGIYDGTTAYLYVNGVLTASNPLAFNTQPGTAQVGKQVNGIEYWSGRISQVQVYNRVLTTDEISQNFLAHRSRYGV